MALSLRQACIFLGGARLGKKKGDQERNTAGECITFRFCQLPPQAEGQEGKERTYLFISTPRPHRYPHLLPARNTLLHSTLLICPLSMETRNLQNPHRAGTAGVREACCLSLKTVFVKKKWSLTREEIFFFFLHLGVLEMTEKLWKTMAAALERLVFEPP